MTLALVLPFRAISELAAIPGDAPLSSPLHAFHAHHFLLPHRPHPISRDRIFSAPSAISRLQAPSPFATDTRFSNASPRARSVTMPARKRAASEMEVEEHVETPSTLQRLRNMWQFANLAQYIAIFGDAVKIDKDLDIEVRPLCAGRCYGCAERVFDEIKTD